MYALLPNFMVAHYSDGASASISGQSSTAIHIFAVISGYERKIHETYPHRQRYLSFSDSVDKVYVVEYSNKTYNIVFTHVSNQLNGFERREQSGTSIKLEKATNTPQIKLKTLIECPTAQIGILLHTWKKCT